MDSEVTMVSTTVQAEVDSERHGSPGRVLGVTVEADLSRSSELPPFLVKQGTRTNVEVRAMQVHSTADQN